jgi:hypothetical protein
LRIAQRLFDYYWCFFDLLAKDWERRDAASVQYRKSGDARRRLRTFMKYRHILPALGRGALLGMVAAVCWLAGQPVAQAQTTLIDDEFNGTSLDTTKWGIATHGWVIDRTRMGNQPVMGADADGTHYVRLKLDTYSPYDTQYDPNPSDGFTNYLFGTEIYANQMLKLGSGLQIEARIRTTNLPSGLVGALFSYGDHGVFPDSLRRDEIDYELVGKLPVNQLWCHVWDDWNPAYGYDKGVHDLTTTPTASGWNRNQWSTYKIRWLNDRVECYVNGILVRNETKILPDDTMRLDLNLWGPASSWAQAYDAAIQPTSFPSSNVSYAMDVDYVRVTTIPPSSGTVLGTGTGVSATYYSNTDFTGNTVSRVDPRVNFNWNTYFPEPTLGQDTFSVHWSGQVQAQYNQVYTFYTRADDGVRLWVNNKLLIDHWQNQTAPVEYSASMQMYAGVKYNLRLDYYQNTGGTSVALLWSSPSTPKQLVPQTQLYPTLPTDPTAPTISVSTPVNSYSYRSLGQANGVAADSGGSGLQQVRGLLFNYGTSQYWNGSAWTSAMSEVPATGTANWIFRLPTLADGHYGVAAVAMDGAGNLTYTPWVQFYIDTQPPHVTVTTPQNGYSYRSLTQAKGTAVDVGPGVASVKAFLFRYSDYTYWNGSAWTSTMTELPVTGIANWTYNMPSLTDGRYVFEALARDYVGNATYTGWITFYIDTKAPTVTVTSPTQNAVYASITQASGTATDTAPGVASVWGRLHRNSDNTYWNGSAWTTGLADVAATGTANWTFKFPALSNGTYWFQPSARDYVGNTGYGPAVTFTVNG